MFSLSICLFFFYSIDPVLLERCNICHTEGIGKAQKCGTIRKYHEFKFFKNQLTKYLPEITLGKLLFFSLLDYD